MCGILAVIGRGLDPFEIEGLSKRMSHRGPDESDFRITENGHILSHERLSIIDLHSGKQPIRGSKSAYMVHNGEIYNHQDLRDGILKSRHFRTQSDSEVIVHLYEMLRYDFLHLLDGDFAFVVVDGDDFIAGRDPMGVKPLYYGIDFRGRIYFASEMKSIADQCKTFATFPPGHYYTPETGFVKYYKPAFEQRANARNNTNLQEIRNCLVASVSKRMMSDVPVGVLLSGGLDSSLIASIASQLLKSRGEKIHSFSVGLDRDAPDVLAARQVAKFLGTEHHEVYFTVEQGLEILDKLIWHLETYDVTTVRASAPMYFLAEAISAAGVKVVLSGEGADEIFGGYLYFRNAPSTDDFGRELIDRVQKLFTADLLRADKSTMAHGVEVRVPFLDRDFLEMAMLIDPNEKRPDQHEGIEKYILRKSFDVDGEDVYLPQDILWRQKEQFSDGVGYDWIDSLILHGSEQISDAEFEKAALKYPYNTPTSREAMYYREIFHRYFPQSSAAQTVRKWIPKWQDNIDPSGRANKAHQATAQELGNEGITGLKAG